MSTYMKGCGVQSEWANHVNRQHIEAPATDAAADFLGYIVTPKLTKPNNKK